MTPEEQTLLLTDHFSQYISDHKKAFIETVLADRTRYVTIVMEDIYQSQNASAVIRTCECMGVQDVHIVQNASQYSVNPKVLKGSNKWLDLIHYRAKKVNNTEACFNNLRANGYRILVNRSIPDCTSIHDVELDDKIALVMGNELNGTSGYALEHADARVKIPMYGFTESMNISVSAAICLNTLITKLHGSDSPWQLSETELNQIRLQWYKKAVRRSNLIEVEFLSRWANRFKI